MTVYVTDGGDRHDPESVYLTSSDQREEVRRIYVTNSDGDRVLIYSNDLQKILEDTLTLSETRELVVSITREESLTFSESHIKTFEERAPAVPQNLTVTTISSSRLDLSWDDVANEDEYRIERESPVGGGWSQIATVGADVTSYSDTGLGTGTQYNYRIRACTSGGACSDYSTDQSAYTQLATPTGLTATAIDENQIDLSWNDVSPNNSGYDIYRDGSFYDSVGDVSSYSDTAAQEGTSHTYQVRATDATIPDSDFSGTASATTPLADPTNLSAVEQGANQIDLSWTDNSNNEDEYAIERESPVGGGFTQIATTTLSSYSDTGLNEGQEYNYRVKAISTSIPDSDYSNENSATTQLAQPTGLTADAVDEDQVNLSWNDNSDNEDNYRIIRDGSEIDTIPGGTNANSYQDTSVAEGTTYSYEVQAISASIPNSENSAPDSATTHLADPTSLSATAAGQDQIDLSWTNNSTHQDEFAIERESPTGGGFSQIATTTQTSYSDTGLDPDTEYNYRVKAVSSTIPDSDYSNEDAATTEALDLAAPTNLVATEVTCDDSTATMEFSFTDNATDEDKFNFYRDGTFWASSSTQDKAGTGSQTHQVSGTALSAGATHTWTARAATTGGTEGPESAGDSYTQRTAPGAPGSLSASWNSSQCHVSLSWTDVSSECEYIVERKLQSESTSQYNQIGTVAQDGTSMIDSDATENTDYDYRVTAQNDHGGSSSTTSITTGTCEGPN